MSIDTRPTIRVVRLLTSSILLASSSSGSRAEKQPMPAPAQWSAERADPRPIISRKGTYSYEASAWIASGSKKWRIWFCGGGAPGIFGDSIFYTVADPTDPNALEARVVLTPANNDRSEDGQHACAPSVIRSGGNIELRRGKGRYILYYECAPRMYDRRNDNWTVEASTQICAARSDDGITWRKYSKLDHSKSDRNPTPIIKIAPQILENCAYRFIHGRHTIDGSKASCSAANSVTNYGSGHPSAIFMKFASPEVWLYYYDSRGDWSQQGVYLAKSRDGVHFRPAIKTDLPNAAHVKYYPNSFGRWSHLFVATTVVGRTNGLLISPDGIHWAPSDGSMIEMGTTSADCAVPGTSDIVGNDANHISSLSLNVLVSEGNLGVADHGPELGCYDAAEDHSRGSTWQIRVLRGRITPSQIAP